MEDALGLRTTLVRLAKDAVKTVNPSNTPVNTVKSLYQPHHGYSIGNILVGGGPSNRNSRSSQTNGFGANPFMHSQYRTFFSGSQGSGHPAKATSSVRTVGNSYIPPKGSSGLATNYIHGPGYGTYAWDEFGGAEQPNCAQDERINQIMRDLVAAHANGDENIHLAGHSRGAGNAVLAAQILNERGLVCPDTGKQIRPPGVKIQSLTLHDAVPHMGETPLSGGTGMMRIFKNGEYKNVPTDHKDACIPDNVENYTHYLAGGEQRDLFAPAMLPAGPNTNARHVIIPNAVHADVGGAPKKSADIHKLVTSDNIRWLNSLYPEQFSQTDIMSPQEHNATLARVKATPPNPGWGEWGLGLLGGSSQRKFPDYAKEIEPMSETVIPADIAARKRRQ